MTLAAAPDALQGAVAAGILGCGSVILGASETAGRLFDEIDARQVHGPATRRRRAARGATLARRRQGDAGLRPPAAQGARSARGGAVRRVAQGRRPTSASSQIAEAVSGRSPRSWQGLQLNVSAAIPAVLLGAGFPLAGAARRADPRAHRGPDRAPQRRAVGSRAASRCRTRPRASWCTTASRRRRHGRAATHDRACCRRACARARHLHHRPGGVDAARPTWAPTWSRSSSPTGDPFRAFKRRPLQPALPDLQPQQESIASTRARRTTCARSTRWSTEADVYIQNFRPGVAEQDRRRRGAAARAQPAPDLLRDQRLRPRRPGRAAAELRHGGAGGERLPEAAGQSRRTRASSARRSPTR